MTERWLEELDELDLRKTSEVADRHRNLLLNHSRELIDAMKENENLKWQVNRWEKK